jgi:hypothetical protein
MRSIDLNAGLVVWHGGHARVDAALKALEPRHVDRRVEVASDDPDVLVLAQERHAPLELIELQVRRILREVVRYQAQFSSSEKAACFFLQ